MAGRGGQEEEDDAKFIKMIERVYGSGFRLELAMRVFGLTHVQDTRVGNAMMRGISGGEKRRLTTAESMVGGKVSSPSFRLPPTGPLPPNLSRVAKFALSCVRCAARGVQCVARHGPDDLVMVGDGRGANASTHMDGAGLM